RGSPGCCSGACWAAGGCDESLESRFLASRFGRCSRIKYEGRAERVSRFGAFTATLVAFFLAEIGDKTQIATVGLAARFEQFYPVVLGTTLGMMLANIPAVLIGGRIAERLPGRGIRLAAAPASVVLGMLTLAGCGG